MTSGGLLAQGSTEESPLPPYGFGRCGGYAGHMTELSRAARARSDDPQNLPRPAGEPDKVVVETAWGTVQPIVPVAGVRTVGELEVAELVRGGDGPRGPRACVTGPRRGQQTRMTLTRKDRTRSGDPQNVPRATDETEVVTVETSWGEVQPMQPVPGIRTVGELEVAELVRDGAQLVDTRVPDSRSGLTLPGAVNIPHDQVLSRRDELSEERVHVLFCNGPQCPQTADALRTLSGAGFPLDRLAYYRGGIHDWVTLAMPTEPV